MPRAAILPALDGSKPQTSFDAITAWSRTLIASMAVLQRDDDALTDGQVRLRSLHAETLAALGLKVPANILPTITVYGDYTLTDGDGYVRVDATLGAVTLTMPPAASKGSASTLAFFVHRVDNSANPVQLVRAPGTNDLVAGLTSVSIAGLGSAILMGDGGRNWDLLSTGGGGGGSGTGSSKVVTKTADYVAGSDDSLILWDCTGGPYTLTLPDAAALGADLSQDLTVKRIDATANQGLIVPSGIQTLEGGQIATFGLQSARLRSNSANAWQVVGTYP